MFSFPKVIYETVSPISGRIRVIDNGLTRRLVVGDTTQSKWDSGKEIANTYWNAFLQVPFPQKTDPKVLILGFGGGTIAKLFLNKFPRASITGVDFNPEILNIAREYFNICEKNITLIAADANGWLKKQRTRNTKHYDFIAVDLFSGDQISPCVFSDEFLANVYYLLTPKDGVLVINFILYKQPQIEAKLLIDKVKKLFSNYSSDKKTVYRFGTIVIPGKTGSDNLVIFAQKSA